MGIDTNLITKTTKDFAYDFICSVCTDLVDSPVTLVTCQHNFCRDCLNGVIEAAGHVEAVYCPDCRPGMGTRFSGSTGETEHENTGVFLF